jgi:hypothetical protein
MSLDDPTPVYPNCSAVKRAVRIGGMSKAELLAELQRNGVELNELAQRLLAHDSFAPGSNVTTIETVELVVRDLGFADGATMTAVRECITTMSLALCPLELGPFLRLQFLDQPEGYWGHPPSQHRAPPGSITVASPQVSDDAEFPKGFYLRRIQGVLWLRGYCAEPEHIWSPEDRLIFRLV